ncbi:MAG: nucleotide pyrophosphohydrolase [Fibrobacterales bacterium]
MEINKLIQKLVAFRDERDWKQFHNLKDLSMALSIEAAELQEVFLWRDAHKADKLKIEEELADVLMYALLMANEAGLDVTEIIEKKLQKNSEKYPVDKSKGNATKWDKL